jgi:hypothetical protein
LGEKLRNEEEKKGDNVREKEERERKAKEEGKKKRNWEVKG